MVLTELKLAVDVTQGDPDPSAMLRVIPSEVEG
jgi:hypothetical protein